jgi:hypothetical protein
MTCQSLCAPENTLTSVARQLLDIRTRALLLRLLFARVICIFGTIEIFIRAWFACSQRASLRRSLGGGHFDALGTSIVSCALRHRASGTMKFAKLSNETSREASPPPRLVDLLHLNVAGVSPHVVNKLHGFLVWKRGLSQSLQSRCGRHER